MRRWVLLLILLAGIFAGLRGLHALAEPPSESAIFTERVVVVGVTGRPQLTPVDRDVLGRHLGDAQVGSISVRAREIPDCAAAGWTTLGAGRRAGIGDLCQPVVADRGVTDWAARRAAATADRGDAQLGTLAASVKGCVGAVGPGAALAAARPDGTLADYRSVDQFVADRLSVSCPITLVDAGAASDQIITGLADDADVTVIVAGVGPAPGSDDRSLQVVYRLGTTLPGWLTSASTRRESIVTLTDLTRTLIDFTPAGSTAPLTVDGSPFTVNQATLTVAGIDRQLRAVAALSDTIPTAYLVIGLLGGALLAVMIISFVRRRLGPVVVIVTGATVLPAAMMLTGSVPWPRAASPTLAISAALVGWWVSLTVLALLWARLAKIPAALAGSLLVLTAFTVDAALGAPMQPGSMLNSRPIFGLRWYGFGNNTFAAYATAALFVGAFAADRLIEAGRRRTAVVAVAAIGFGAVICEGWPSMGSDFGGVIALTPPVLWLVLKVSGVRVTWPKLVLVGGSAVVAIAAISLLDWRRGPDRRSHLGNFVQRIIDGDAVDVVSRKAVASLDTIVSPWGLAAVVLGVAAWVVMFRRLAPLAEPELSTVRPALLAIMGTGILGTVLNDAGISVWTTATAMALFTMAWFWAVDRARRAWTRDATPAVRR